MMESLRQSKEQLALVLQVVKHNPALLSWFRGLAHLPDPSRASEVQRLVGAMKANHEDETLVTTLQLLADAKLFRAAMQAIENR
jgi:hypothetical protein